MQLDLAVARQQWLAAKARDAAVRAERLFLARMGNDFDTSWAGLLPELRSIVTLAQIAAAAGASQVANRTAAADGRAVDPDFDEVEPGAFAGVDASGRDIDGLLHGSVTTAKTAVGRGAGPRQALLTGAGYLSMMTLTAVMDTGRSADLTAATGRRYTHYVRVIQPGACSRCAILAGTSSGQVAFKRHPGCRCTAAPENDPKLKTTGKYASATDYFESMSPAEQDRIFTRAGAEAIRAGGDPITVVTARRGATGIDYGRGILNGKTLPNSGRRLTKSVIGRDRAGQPILGYTTGESTTIRGAFAKQSQVAGSGRQRPNGARYRSVKRLRLMPETIVDLTQDPQLRRVLLRDAGYIRYPATRAETRAPIGGFLKRRDALIRDDRAAADAFYRSRGISLG